MKHRRFTHFAAIDWSGAAGERQRGIAVALCSTGDATPLLVRPGHRWSRAEVLAWLGEDLPAATLVGCDLSASLPYADQDAFFPGWDGSPPDARALWALVDRICQQEPHLGAASLLIMRRPRATSAATAAGWAIASAPARGACDGPRMRSARWVVALTAISIWWAQHRSANRG